MKELFNRLSSRSFIALVGSFLVFVARDQWAEAMGVVIAYLTAKGVSEVSGNLGNLRK